MKAKQSKYPPYPESARDYSVVETARQQLRKPNRRICVYCWGQAVEEKNIVHKADCPAYLALEKAAEKEAKVKAATERPWREAYVKWLAEQVKPEDGWTEEEIMKAMEATDFDNDSARGFKGGWKAAWRKANEKRV